MYGEIRLFAGTANSTLAREIGAYLEIPLSDCDIVQFPNENIFVRLHKSVRGQDVFVIQPVCRAVNTRIGLGVESFSSIHDNLVELLIMIDCLKRASAGRITAVVPYFPYSRSDKKDAPRVPITARLVADIITVAGASRYLTIDLHAGQIQGFFSIPGDEITAFHIQRDYLLAKSIPDAVVVAPDVGASKRGRNFAQALNVPLAIVEKRRVGTETEVLTLIGDVEGRNAIIVDDEIDTAGTFADAAKVLWGRGAREIYGCAAHAILSPPAVERIRELGLKELVLTNTVMIPREKILPNMTILSVAPLLGEVIKRIHLGISVGEMFGE